MYRILKDKEYGVFVDTAMIPATNKTQQIPFIDIFIDLFKSALHVSDDKLAHPQEQFLTLYTAFGTMHRYCCRLATISVHCTKSSLYSQKVLLRMGEFVARNM